MPDSLSPDSLSPDSLSDVLNPKMLLQKAGTRSYQRGQDYFERRAVRSLVQHENNLSAQVSGTRTYQVRLWLQGDRLLADCSCPMGDKGDFCKHCVAVGLAWLASDQETAAGEPVTTLQDVRDFLQQQDRQTLVEMILEQAQEDHDWYQYLLMTVAAGRPQGPDLATFEQALRDAIETNDYIDYREMYAYAQRILTVIASLEDLLDKGHADGVIDLCEYALPLLEESLSSLDDSDGYIGGILADVQQLHRQACEVARPDPEELAEKLFDWEVNSSYETFYGALEKYAEILGETGLAIYRRLAEAEWDKLPKLTAGERGSFDGKRWRLSEIMQQLARQAGDLDALVEIHQHDLSNDYRYLVIAQLYQQADQHDLALQWAERGLAAFPQRTDRRLQDFLVEEYQRRGRFEDAMAIVWNGFTESSELRNYQKLKTQAERGECWPQWREKSLAYLREQIEQAKSAASMQEKRRVWGFRPIDHSTLVEIFLWENEAELAWQEAQKGGCSRQLWLNLAAQRQHTHPADALLIYRREIEPLIEQTNNQAYTEAVSYLVKIRDLMQRLDQQQEFAQWLGQLRNTYKRKRNFIKLLDRQQW